MNAHQPATKADLEQIGDNLNVLSVDLHALRDVFAAKGDRKVVAGLQVDVEQLRKQF